MDARLKYVVAVARNGSFTAAADDVGVTQSAITNSIADLEQQIGYAIFHRTSRGSFLTEEGRDFVDRASRLLDDTNELLQRPEKNTDPYAGALRIGVGPASIEWRLVPTLTLLLRRHPSIRFDISGSTFERTVQLLRTGAIDVALGFDAAFADWPDIRRTSIAPVRSCHFVRKGHPLLERRTLALRDLTEFPYIGPSEGRPYGVAIRKLFEDRGLDWQHCVHTVDYFPLVKRIVERSDAIGITSALYAQGRTFQERFEELKVSDMMAPSVMCCATRKRWEPKPAVRAFIRAMKGTEAAVAETASMPAS